jgi:8-oxo-dGTP pyrophosphatase MutT (NUDIX family)
MDGAPAGPSRGSKTQVAALCWRQAATLEILLVTTLRSRRWILPKGWPQEGLSLAQSAAAEALEEAGVTGDISTEPVGRYHYLKDKNGSALPCAVEIFPLLVTGQRETWPEKGERQLLWLPADKAVLRVAEQGLKRILLEFGKARHAA